MNIWRVIVRIMVLIKKVKDTQKARLHQNGPNNDDNTSLPTSMMARNKSNNMNYDKDKEVALHHQQLQTLSLSTGATKKSVTSQRASTQLLQALSQQLLCILIKNKDSIFMTITMSPWNTKFIRAECNPKSNWHLATNSGPSSKNENLIS